MLLPDRLPPVDPQEMVTYRSQVDGLRPLVRRVLRPTYYRGGLTVLERAEDPGDLGGDYQSTWCSRSLQILADAGMREALETVGVEGRSYATDVPEITAYAMTSPLPQQFINRANRLVKPNGPINRDEQFTLVPFQGTFRTYDQFAHLSRREIPFDVTDADATHETVFHGPALLALMNSAVLCREIHAYATNMWNIYKGMPFGQARDTHYGTMRDFTREFDVTFLSPVFATLVLDPEHPDILERFAKFFSWKAPNEIPPLVAAAHMAITNYQQPAPKW